MKALQIFLMIAAVAVGIGTQTTGKSKLTGTIYDPYGAITAGAKVTAVGNGKTFTTTSNGDGVYSLDLPFSRYDRAKYTILKYDISVESPGFKLWEIRSFPFGPSQFGKMYLDIALDVGRITAETEHP